MNEIPGKISEVFNKGNLSLVKISIGNSQIQSIILENRDSVQYLQEGKDIRIMFKETELILSKSDPQSISIENHLPCILKEMEVGKILTRVVLEYEGHVIVAIISTQAAKNMDLKEEDRVTALIKSNEIMITDD